MELLQVQQLLALQFSLIPVKPREKVAAGKWQKYQTQRRTIEEITACLNSGYANFAVVTGEISGCIVVDIDNADALAQVAELGFPETTPIVSTGKGYHLYFSYPKDVAEKVGKVKTGVNIGNIQGLDLRADGGYVLAPGSIHPSGRVYKWHVEPRVYDFTAYPSVFPEIPEWLRTILITRHISETGAQTKGVTGVRADSEVDSPARGNVGEGSRNVQMHRIAASLRTRGKSRREIYERLCSENERFNPPLHGSELATIADSASRYQVEIGDYHLTESGNAQRMIDAFGDDLIYVSQTGKWQSWDGKRWIVEHADGVQKYAQQVASLIHDDADKCNDDKAKKKLFTWALGSEAAKKVTACVKLAKPYLSVSSSQLDRNQWILNAPNGIIDLHTGELMPHDRKEYCSKMAGAEYHPDAECPRWLQFLDEITGGNFELQSYLQRIVGYSLTGDTSEHVWFMLLGNGRNGKSTFLNAVQTMMADYSSNIRPEALLMQGMDKVPNDLAALKGARFTAASETPASRKLNEALIKQLTGGDAVQARFLFQEFFEFKPQCKLFLATNYRPNIVGTDVGIWRRTHEVPFPVSIPESECDPNLPAKLDAEISGILAWAVRGCIEWQRRRLDPPQAVQSARQEYYEEMDTVGQFIREWCEVDEMPNKSNVSTSVTEIYRAFSAWCLLGSEDLMTKRAFGMKLTQRNIPSVRMKDGGRGRRGIALRAHEVQRGRVTEWVVQA